MVTIDELVRICPYTPRYKLERFINPLNAAMREFEIDTPVREAMFLAQAAHETGGFRWLKEFASGEEYEGRKDLGNDQPGDGARYKGRGIFQLTGEANYEAAGTALFLDPDWFRSYPELAEREDYACRIAGWYWKSRGLNELADKGDYLAITKRINGGTNGWQDRMAYLERANKVLA